ncbi:MAG TPA: hypothetical protein VHL11_20050 [Phototrophicaceae bacterium]|jgi:hypothetical protein|nr:hypothetical protein [Phototrophicaceae bacterium]
MADMLWTDEQIPGEPITVWTPYPGWNWVRDSPSSQAQLKPMWDASKEKIYHIANLLNIEINMDDLILATSGAAHGENAFFNHPNLKLAIVVTKDPVMKMAVENMIQSMAKNTGVYEQIGIMVMDNLEGALDHIRKQISAQKATS